MVSERLAEHSYIKEMKEKYETEAAAAAFGGHSSRGGKI